MSHVVHVQTEVRDPVAIRAACERLQLPAPVFGEAKLFSAAATGWQVQLPQWRYPAVCDVTTGQVAYDNFEGRWGDPRQLGRFLQAYAVEKCRWESHLRGHSCHEQILADGSIKLRISVGGAI